MKLFLLSQDVVTCYNSYDSAVVCCDTKEEARLTHPCGYRDDWNGKHRRLNHPYHDWCEAEDVQVTEIGLAHPNTGKGVVCASFNAG